MIVVNARFLTQKITGVQRFGIEIARQLKKMLPDAVFVSPGNIIHQEYAQELGVNVIGKNKGVLWEQFDLPAYLKKNGKPLLLNLCNVAPLNYRNQIVTIHDVAFMVNPGWFSKKFVWFYKFLVPRIAKRAKLVLTVSNFSRNEIVKYLNIDEGKISIVYNGVADFPKPAPSPNQYGRYLLIVCSIDKRKNIGRLMEAFKQVRQQDVKLLIAGDTSAIFNNKGGDEYIDDRIVFLGRVSDDALHQLYSNALAFVYPSLYEGFGIPPLEAIAFGCPVIVSGIGSLKEVCGDAALFVDPYSVDDIAKKISFLIDDPVLRSDLIEKGKKIVGKYSWERSAQIVADSVKHLN